MSSSSCALGLVSEQNTRLACWKPERLDLDFREAEDESTTAYIAAFGSCGGIEEESRCWSQEEAESGTSGLLGWEEGLLRLEGTNVSRGAVKSQMCRSQRCA